MLAFGRVANGNYIRSKRVEFENQALLSRVTEEKQVATQAVLHKNQFLAATSHDLRQPLHGLGLYIDVLVPRMKDPVDKDIVEKLKNSSNALNELLHGLLEIARLDASAIKNNPIHCKLSNILDRFIKEVEAELEGLPITLECDVSEKIFVLVDPNLCERILRNLLSNAVKYTQQGFIRVSAIEKQNNVELRVSDSGIGVEKEKLDDIFVEFTQLHNPERDRTKGLGLGLSIVRRLCDLQGLPFNFESELGTGSTFTLQLTKGEVAMSPLQVRTIQSTIRNLTILCIDDEQAIRDAMKLMIESWQCIPLIAADRAQAFQQVHQHDDHIDIILSDLRLRNNDNGVELITAIREELNLDTPAIVVTGDTAQERLSMVNLPNLVLMHKPIAAAELRHQIEQLILGSD